MAFDFPAITGPKLNLGCGRDIKPTARGWVNLDGFVVEPGVVKHDIAQVPWPFKDGEFDLVYCSHVLEHIAPIFREHQGTKRDVIFDIFEEIHRVLKPGGLLFARVPWGYSHEGLAHIQHYRQWRPEWAQFFEPDHVENYYTSARFRLESWRRTRDVESLRLKHKLLFGDPPISLTSHLSVRLPFLRKLLWAPSELQLEMRKV